MRYVLLMTLALLGCDRVELAAKESGITNPLKLSREEQIRLCTERHKAGAEDYSVCMKKAGQSPLY